MRAIAFSTLLLVTAVAAAAQETALAELPGYVPFEQLSLLAPGETNVEINLRRGMLQMVAAFAGQEEPELAEVVAALDVVRVRSGELAPARRQEVLERAAESSAWLERHGWLATVAIREGDEATYIYTREVGGELVGMTIIAVEQSEVTAVNLIGRIDPARLGQLGRALDLEVLEDTQPRLGAAREDSK